MTTSLFIDLAGSSPLTRGKQEAYDSLCKRCRLIPAHAGKTMVLLIKAASSQAHPRSRGENLPV